MSKTIELSGDKTQELYMNDGDEFLILEDSTDWSQDRKYQLADFIYKHTKTGDFYRLSLSRSGSPFTDWNYSYEYNKPHTLSQVEKQEIKTFVWKEVK